MNHEQKRGHRKSTYPKYWRGIDYGWRGSDKVGTKNGVFFFTHLGIVIKYLQRFLSILDIHRCLSNRFLPFHMDLYACFTLLKKISKSRENKGKKYACNFRIRLGKFKSSQAGYACKPKFSHL